MRRTLWSAGVEVHAPGPANWLSEYMRRPPIKYMRRTCIKRVWFIGIQPQIMTVVLAIAVIEAAETLCSPRILGSDMRSFLFS